MASTLTSASLKSGFLYLIFFAFIVLGTSYLLFFQQPSVVDNLNRQSFRLNYAAFKNGILLANYKFTAGSISSHQSQLLDRWVHRGIGLDYNSAGFPIGTNITNSQQEKPLTALDCQQLWQFVLGPLQPSISDIPNQTEYWVELTSDNVCIYHLSNIKNLVVLYQSKFGKVDFFEYN